MAEDGMIAVYTAVMGRFDYLEAPKVRGNARFIAFVDRETHAPGWEIHMVGRAEDTRRAAREFKLLPHKYLPEATESIWLDGNIELLVDPQRIVDNWLAGYDLATFRHPDRDCIYEEARVCVKSFKEKQDIAEAQIDRYREVGFPQNWGLVESSVVARRHTQEVVDFNEAWWRAVSEGSVRDQLSFNYVCWRLGLEYNPMASARTHKWFKFRMIHGGKSKTEVTMEPTETEEKAEEKPKKESKRKKRQLPKLKLQDGMAIGANGRGLAIMQNGERRQIPDVTTQIDLGVGMHHVVMLHPEQFDAVPEGEPMPSILPEWMQDENLRRVPRP